MTWDGCTDNNYTLHKIGIKQQVVYYDSSAKWLQESSYWLAAEISMVSRFVH